MKAAIVAGWVADRIFGDPARFHPVAAIGYAESLNHVQFVRMRCKIIIHIAVRRDPDCIHDQFVAFVVTDRFS